EGAPRPLDRRTGRRAVGEDAMKGSTFKRPGAETWTIKYDMPRGQDGKRRTKMQAGFATEADAQRGLRKALSQVDAGTFTEPSKQTVADYLRDWLKAAKLDMRPSSVPFYEITVER